MRYLDVNLYCVYIIKLHAVCIPSLVFGGCQPGVHNVLHSLSSGLTSCCSL